MSFSIKKFAGGFNIFNGATFGKILYYVIIVAICLGIFWAAFIKPTQTQQAESITNITQEDDTYWFKLQVWGLRLQI